MDAGEWECGGVGVWGSEWERRGVGELTLNQVLHVFAYGTLKPGEQYFGEFCEAYVQQYQTAIAPGRLYHFPALGYPAMTLESGWVQGVLFTFDTTAVLDLLDELEDYFPDRPEDSEYQRIRHPIYTPEQVPLVEAWVYVMTRQQVEARGGQWLPAGDWRGRHHAPMG